MKEVPYLDLEHLAHRGPLERGLRYLRVHTMRSANGAGSGFRDPSDPPFQPHAHEMLALSNLRVRRSESRLVPGFVVLGLGRYGSNQWVYAGDAGLWDVPGAYENTSNYTLDIAALRRAGIRPV